MVFGEDISRKDSRPIRKWQELATKPIPLRRLPPDMEKKVPKQCTVGQPAQCYKVLRSAPKGRIMLLRATSYKMLPSTEKCCTVRLSESGRSVADNGRASGAGSLGGELKMMMTMIMIICGDCQDARDAITL